jgi:hypothetical protein
MKWLMLLSLAAIPAAHAQIRRGSVGVVYYTDEKIVMAADSRGTYANADLPADDTVCKIAAPHEAILSVYAGASDYQSAKPFDLAPSWSANDEIHEAYDAASLRYSKKRDRLEATASEWARSMISQFEIINLGHPFVVAEVARKQNGLLGEAMFGGVDDDGKLLLLMSMITVDPNIIAALPKAEIDVIACPNSFCSVGRGEIKKEFVNLESERAKQEAKNWIPPKGSKPEDLDILRTMRLVELTIQYHDDDVGGPIDAVQMDKYGAVRWFARKPDCPEQ